MKTVKVCAAPGVKGEWHSIDWAKHHKNVRRLQARIAKATKDGKHGKVKALQWLLTHSYSGKAIAVKRVTENKGKNTPGVDKETWSTPEAKSQGIASLKRRGYRPQPLRRVLIPKSNGKMRPLGIPTIKDRAMQALYLLALEPVAETQADKNSYGFRPARATADAAEQCFNALSRKNSPQWILEGDIKACFDEISHEWLLNNIPMDKRILQQWLKAGYIHEGRFSPTETGTPQGGIISPCLANMTLDGLETKLLADLLKRKGTNVNLIRYADDFIVTGRTKELLENEVKPRIEQFLKERGLELSQEKTRITHIKDGFDFLGWNIRKYDNKLLIKPSEKNVASFLEDVRRTIKENKQAKQESLIELLNPKIRGWSNYHKNQVAKETFSKVDREIWKTLWQWAKRRHPSKDNSWIKNRYFKRIELRDWVFTVTKGTTLVKASDTKIQRHVKIRAEANPYLPESERYFEERLAYKMKGSLKDKRRLSLWTEQKGICPNCRQNIGETDEANIHHIQPIIDGGKDILTNLVLLHGNCHRQVHSLKLTVSKPVVKTA